MIKKGEKVLLLGKKNYLVKAEGEFHCQFGKIDLKRIIGKKIGCKIKSNTSEEFAVVKPSIVDFLKHAKRGPQVVLPKDSAAILAETGCSPDFKIVDVGTGSGFLAIFMANFAKKVYTYEKNKKFFALAKENIKNSGLKNIKIKNKDITKGIDEKNIDLITLDLENPEKVVAFAYKALKQGGFLVVYSMHIEEVQRVCSELRNYNFTSPKIIENIQREWQIEGGTFTRPKTHMLAHTGFLTFARKLL